MPVCSVAAVSAAALAGSPASLAAPAYSAAAVLAVAPAGFRASAWALVELPVLVVVLACFLAVASESDAKPVRSVAPKE